ncbi:MAG: hypothetical protein HY366_01215, partial [Candidatus Aenigmarchaeota archaeon]|nr:hypothetical protein [Candidatus Aenigmarchaeota archaeon]
ADDEGLGIGQHLDIRRDGSDVIRIRDKSLQLVPTDTPPACSANAKGALYYNNGGNRLCYCNGNNWLTVDGANSC